MAHVDASLFHIETGDESQLQYGDLPLSVPFTTHMHHAHLCPSAEPVHMCVCHHKIVVGAIDHIQVASHFASEHNFLRPAGLVQ